METSMRVTGHSLVQFMVAFRNRVGRCGTVRVIRETIKDNSHLLKQHPNGIPINIPHINGVLVDGWFDAMREGWDAFQCDDWSPHFYLSGMTLSGARNHPTNIHGATAQYNFIGNPRITFSKEGFPTKDALVKKTLLQAKTHLLEIADRAAIGAFAAQKQAIRNKLEKVNFQNQESDRAIFAAINNILREEFIEFYDLIIRELELIDKLFIDSKFLTTDPADPLLNSKIWHRGNRGIFNTSIIARGMQADSQVGYDSFVIDDMSWLADNERSPRGSTLHYSHSVFPRQVHSFLSALQETNRNKQSREAFYTEFHVRSRTLRGMEKYGEALTPTSFILPIYFHNSEQYQWQIDMWI